MCGDESSLTCADYFHNARAVLGSTEYRAPKLTALLIDPRRPRVSREPRM